MTIRIYNLGNQFNASADEIAQNILQKLKDEKKYEMTHLYRGLAATPAILRRIHMTGTDRVVKPRLDRVLRAIEREENDGRELDPSFISREADLRLIWAGGEENLPGIIDKYATSGDPVKKGSFPLILAYRRADLDFFETDIYRFKDGVNPRDAIVAGLRFK
jgi:hypothetical protein